MLGEKGRGAMGAHPGGGDAAVRVGSGRRAGSVGGGGAPMGDCGAPMGAGGGGGGWGGDGVLGEKGWEALKK